MQRDTGLASLVVLLAVACGPVPARRLIPDFPKHRQSLVAISDGLLSLHATAHVGHLLVGQNDQVTFLSDDEAKLDTSALFRAIPDSVKVTFRRLASLAPQLLISGMVERDQAVVLMTGSGGATGPHWGYVRAGTGGVVRLRQLFQSALDTLPHETEWFVFIGG
jgi:hypothetical protein